MRRRSKERAFKRDWKAQIIRSARRSAASQSIHVIRAQGHPVLTSHPHTPHPHAHTHTHMCTPSPQPPSSQNFQHLLASFSACIYSKKTGPKQARFWWKVQREQDGTKRSPIPQPTGLHCLKEILRSQWNPSISLRLIIIS